MKSSIEFLAIIALFVTFSVSANAQRGGGQRLAPEESAEKDITQMVEKLGLDETQTAKIKEINIAYAEKTKAAMEENKGNREAMKVIREAIVKEKNAEMKLVLTESQYATYEEMSSKKGQRQGKRGNRQRRN